MTIAQGVSSEAYVALDKTVQLWSEFTPAVYTLQVSVSLPNGTSDEKKIDFGLREFKPNGTRFEVNGTPIFLRGTLECCIFPLTGYPATDDAYWEKIYTACQTYGLNHVRFHSWCPPEAAFRVADRMGVYLQVECGGWANIGNGDYLDKWFYEEGDRILKEYGNHPSFCLMNYGNEPSGANQEKYLSGLVAYWKQKDNRRVYTSAAGWPYVPNADYWNHAAPRIQGWGEELKSRINANPPTTDYDFWPIIKKDMPTVSHEIGQWCVYPDLDERSQYTGVMKAKNFDIFEDRLRESGLLSLADSFLLASGKLQVLCYKADIEAALRTKGFGGFQLLDLHDFPGQGTALVGVLNPFWRSKGYVTSREFSEFCNDVVPLARMERFILNNGETLNASIEIAQYSAFDLSNARTAWKLTAQDGTLYRSGSFDSTVIPTGTLTKVGDICMKMEVDKPTRFTLEVSLDNYVNRWHIWVYPNQSEKAEEVKVASCLDEEALAVLNKGGKVLLTPTFGTIRNEGADSVVIGFSSIFWNTLWTNGQAPHTLGILCNPKHPALSLFPTDYHSDYQWQDAMSHCNAIPLRKLGKDFQPIVRIIDDWFTARSLGLIIEMKVGNGKLLMCGADLLTDADKRPEARQLMNSLLRYMKSDAFKPLSEVKVDAIRGLFKE